MNRFGVQHHYLSYNWLKFTTVDRPSAINKKKIGKCYSWTVVIPTISSIDEISN